MKSIDVEVFDEEWVRRGNGTIYQSLEEERDVKIKSCKWLGEPLCDLAQFTDVEFYRIDLEGTDPDEETYVRALGPNIRDDAKRSRFHSVFYPLSFNNEDAPKFYDKNNKDISDSKYEDLKKGNIYLKMY